jgi:hypothetical protein
MNLAHIPARRIQSFHGQQQGAGSNPAAVENRLAGGLKDRGQDAPALEMGDKPRHSH